MVSDSTRKLQLILLVYCSQEASYQAMVAREHEEEQTQRSMLALNKLKLMVAGKTAEEAEKDIAKVRADMSMIYHIVQHSGGGN